ncbi:MAG: hypothetical protein ABH919_02105 [bacterium]
MFKYLNKGISTPIAIAVILLLAIIVGGIMLWQYSEIEKAGLIELESSEENETANWKTYRNEEYGFEYPKDFKIEVDNAVKIVFPESYIGSSYTFKNDVTGAWIYTGIGIMESKGFSGDFCQGLDSQKIEINNIDFIKSNTGDVAMGGRYSDYTIYSALHNGVCYEIVLAVNGDDPGAGANDGMGPLSKDYYADLGSKEKFTLIFNQMLSTFEFIEKSEETIAKDEMLNWKIYNNEVLELGSEKIGFTMEYPEDWDYTTKFSPQVFFGEQNVIENLESAEPVVGDKDLGIIINAYSKRLYEGGILPYRMKPNEYLSATSSDFEVDGVQGTYYLSEHLISRLGYQKGDKTVTVDLMLDNGYLSIHLLNYKYLDIFEEMISTFKF